MIMVEQKIIEYIRVLPIVCAILCIGLAISSAQQPEAIRANVQEGTLYCFQDDQEYWCALSDFCVKDGYLYLLFGGKGVLKVYDTQGTYLMSYGFRSFKGQPHLFVDDHAVYLQDEIENYYSFSESRWVGFFSGSDRKTNRLREERFAPFMSRKRTEGENSYIQKLGSVYRISEDGASEVVVSRPLPLAVFQGITLWVIFFAFFLLAVVVMHGETKEIPKTEPRLLGKNNSISMWNSFR